MNQPRAGTAQIEAALRAALQPTEIEVGDDSHLHAGHAGAREGGHYSVRIRSARFAGLSRVARHRLVYDSLGSLMTAGIHALIIDAQTPMVSSVPASPDPLANR
jgi:BolA family transcriptional regulator, general stress-responsive regulator